MSCLSFLPVLLPAVRIGSFYLCSVLFLLPLLSCSLIRLSALVFFQWRGGKLFLPLLQHRVFPAGESPVPQQHGWGLGQPFGAFTPAASWWEEEGSISRSGWGSCCWLLKPLRPLQEQSWR